MVPVAAAIVADRGANVLWNRIQILQKIIDGLAREVGMAFQGFQDIKEGDIIECFTLEEVKRTL